MRTLAAILLWGILLFNWVGYRLATSLMQRSATRQLEARLDNRQYDESQLISIKVPVTRLSYYNHSTIFERVDGQIEINGIPYQYVKRRFYNDSLELLCIPNQMALKLRHTGDEYFITINEIQHSQRDQHPFHPGYAKSFIGDPFTLIDMLQLGALSSMEIIRACCYQATVPSMSIPADERPPAGVA